MRAVDPDVGVNGEVRYRIRKDSNGNHNIFQIDEESGQITLQSSLDREVKRTHAIRVEAYDLGLPTPLQSDLDIVILVENVNDHLPQFIVDDYSLNFTENQPAGLEQRQVLRTVDLDDQEDGVNISVCYYIVKGNKENLFHLDPLNHQLTTLQQLDREHEEIHNLVIKATEDCTAVPESISQFDPADDTLLNLSIHVTDINDNSPVFDQQVFTGGVSTDLEFGARFMWVAATDLDDGRNAEIEYTVCSGVKHMDSEGFGREEEKLFLIDRTTGEVLLNFDPQENQKGYFRFSVCARDPGGQGDTATVVVYLLRQDQRVRFVTRSQPEEIR